jgi:di/tricarboxylate transporter
MIENMLVELVGLSIVIFAAVAWMKQMGAEGKTLTVSAFVFGVILGVAYRYAVLPMADFASWFWSVIFGLMAGFLASGAYKGAEALALKSKS